MRGTQMMAVRLADDTPGIGAAGQVVRLALTPADVTIQEELDTYAAGYSPLGFVAAELSPPFLVEKDTDKYRFFGSNNAFRLVNLETSDQAPVRQVDPETSLKDYTVIPRALGSFLPANTEAQANYDLRMAATRRIQWALALDREKRLFDMLTTTANWAAANVVTLAATFNWNGGSASDPIKDLQDRIEASAQPVTQIAFSPPVSHVFLRHASVRDHMRQMLGDNAPTPATLEGASVSGVVRYQIPGLPPIVVAPSKYLNETTSNLDFVLGDYAILLTTPPGGAPSSPEEIVTAQTFRRRGPSGTGITSREFIVEERGLDGGTMLVQGHAEDIVMPANNCGGLIADIIQ